MLSGNPFRFSHGLKRQVPGSARVSRAGFGVAPKQSFGASQYKDQQSRLKKSSRSRDALASMPEARATRDAYSRESLRAFFECSGFIAQLRENFAGEMK
jgi:hypothetical protein